MSRKRPSPPPLDDSETRKRTRKPHHSSPLTHDAARSSPSPCPSTSSYLSSSSSCLSPSESEPDNVDEAVEEEEETDGDSESVEEKGRQKHSDTFESPQSTLDLRFPPTRQKPNMKVPDASNPEAFEQRLREFLPRLREANDVLFHEEGDEQEEGGEGEEEEGNALGKSERKEKRKTRERKARRGLEEVEEGEPHICLELGLGVWEDTSAAVAAPHIKEGKRTEEKRGGKVEGAEEEEGEEEEEEDEDVMGTLLGRSSKDGEERRKVGIEEILET